MSNYYVLDGQPEPICYGGSATLTGAKRLAGDGQEYWDAWHGWHSPGVYRAEDTAIAVAHGMLSYRDGERYRYPTGQPVA